MLVNEQGRLAIALCTGVMQPAASHDMVGLSGMAAHYAKAAGNSKPTDHGKADMPCAFSSLAAAALGGEDVVLLVSLFAYKIAIGIAPLASPKPLEPSYLRPPLRGPPLLC